jgi:hypothetical protein
MHIAGELAHPVGPPPHPTQKSKNHRLDHGAELRYSRLLMHDSGHDLFTFILKFEEQVRK